MKKIIITVIIFLSIFTLINVGSQPLNARDITIQKENLSSIEKQNYDDYFELFINSYYGIKPGGGFVECKGYHQYFGGPIKQLFPIDVFWQYTTIEVINKPDWAIVDIPFDTLLSHPDGRKQNFSIYVSVDVGSPSGMFGVIDFNIYTGSYLRHMLGMKLEPFYMSQPLIITTVNICG